MDKAVFLLEKKITLKKTFSKASDGLISVPPASFPRGRPMSRFTHLRSLQGLIYDAQSPRSVADSTPINLSENVSFLFFHTNSSEKWGEMLSDSTSQ